MYRLTLIALTFVALVLVSCDRAPAAPSASVTAPASEASRPDAEPPPPAAEKPMSSQPPSVDPASVDLRNRLGDETSPYLLQHQHNPVAWYAWGPEAFEAARALDRPIFLSVGYSTCYWCHVMERESFENEQIAAIMNEHFICIKVDREERPDVDDIYMTAVQLLTGQGGWPMSVFIDPYTLRPFLGGTYFPPTDSLGRPGFPSVLNQVTQFWTTQRELVVQQAERLAARITEQLATKSEPVAVGAADTEKAVSHLLASYDRKNGGFTGSPGKAPKFPTPPMLDFLIGAAWDNDAARAALVHTLDRMATGGMYDQVGGGFHRYSTDAQWLVPHFEKMLYDQGQLASTYAEAFERTGDAYYAEIVRETLDYVLREMTSPDGAFFSAQDAEVNHREGQNYLWNEASFGEALSAANLDDLVDFAAQAYGVDRGTNFQDPHHPEDPPANVIHLADRPDRIAAARGLTVDEVGDRLQRVNAALLAVRDTRDQPITDDKILTSWNGLMIAGMADGGRVLGESMYVDAAARAADWILLNMRDDEGGLLRTARNGTARIPAFLEDYACFIRGLLALNEAGRTVYLDRARELAAVTRDRFRDEDGGFFDTLADQSDLFVRTRAAYDGAVPSGSSVMLQDLLDLYVATEDAAYLDDAMATLGSMSQAIARQPTAPVLSTLALHRIGEISPDRLAGSEVVETPPTVTTSSTPIRPGLNDGEKLRVRAEPRKVTVPDGGESVFEVRIDVGHGWHVNAHAPGIDYLIPLEITLVEGSGVTITPAYPAGEAFAGPDGQMKVHHGTVAIPVTVRRTGPIRGMPKIMLSYQICNDKVCLAPDSKRIPVAIVEE